MTAEDVKTVLHCAYKPLVLAALSYVNLTDKEFDTLVLRHMRGHTQEEVAEEMDRSVNTIQNWERAALDKCLKAWKRMAYIRELIKIAR